MAQAGTTVDDPTGDLWGGGVLNPVGTITPNGMKFSGTVSDGSTCSGRMVNQIGHGYDSGDVFMTRQQTRQRYLKFSLTTASN
jgi:hypothetical protein